MKRILTKLLELSSISAIYQIMFGEYYLPSSAISTATRNPFPAMFWIFFAYDKVDYKITCDNTDGNVTLPRHYSAPPWSIRYSIIFMLITPWEWLHGYSSTLINGEIYYNEYIDGLEQNCSISSALAMEILQYFKQRHVNIIIISFFLKYGTSF